MSDISTKLTTIAENQEKVYDAGIDKAIVSMWKILHNYGTRTTGWSGILSKTPWTKKTFTPQYPIDLGTDGYYLTENCPPSEYYKIMTTDDQVSMIELEEKFGEPILNTSKATSVTKMCVGGLFKDWGTIDLSVATNTAYTFYGGYINGYKHLMPTRIKRLILSETTVFHSTMFQYASGYEQIGFEGVIGQSGLNLQWSSKLNKESLISIINTLSANATGQSITLSQTAVNAIDWSGTVIGETVCNTWDEVASTKSNWTISLA